MAPKTVTIIEARAKSVPAQVRALWQYRHLYIPLFRDLTVKKYRGSVLGIYWIAIKPIVPTALAVYTFTVVTSIQTHGLPYIIFYLSGFMTWTLFAATTNFSARTLMWSSGIVRRSYFPKLLIPLASLGSPLIEFLVVFSLFIVALLYFYFNFDVLYLRPDAGFLLVPVMFFMALMMAIAIGMLLGVIALFVQDVLYTISYLMQLFMFLTPVFYPATVIPEAYRWIMYLINPLAVLVETTRWAMTGQGELEIFFLLYSCVMVLVIFSVAVVLFFRAEDYLGEVL